MEQYQFVIGTQPFELKFWVTADSPEQAVAKANSCFAESESHKIDFAFGGFDAKVIISDQTKVTAADIAQKRPVPVLPEAALQLLYAYDYQSDGADIDHWRELLTEDVEAIWTKCFIVGEITTGRDYGRMTVIVRRSSFSNKWLFRFKAYIYMDKRAEGLSGPNGGLKYSVDFTDNQEFIGEAEFPDALPAYEKKFSELIYLLRAGDPVDGIALTQAERLTGEIEGFMPRFKPRSFDG